MIVLIALDFFGQGAVSRGARQQVRALLRAGYRVTVITDSDDDLNKVFLKERNKNRFRVVVAWTVNLPRYFLVGKELSFAISCYKALFSLTKEMPIHLVINQVSTACYPVVHFSKWKSVPNVFVIRALMSDRILSSANPYDQLTTEMYKVTNRYAVSKMQYCIAISEYIKGLAIAEGAIPENVFVLHNPVDTERFHPEKTKTKDIDILFVGRLSVEKGVSVFLKAAEQLYKEVRILIIGDGVLRRTLERKAQKVGCQIIFKGWIENKLLPEYICRSTIQVVPSLSEPQGRVVLEGMACGVPIIASKTGGIPEMITHGKNGWLVPPNNPEALADTIKVVLSNVNELEAAGRAAFETAKEFCISQYNSKLVELFEGMMGRKECI